MNDSLVNQVTLLCPNYKVNMGGGEGGEEWIGSVGLADASQYILNG